MGTRAKQVISYDEAEDRASELRQSMMSIRRQQGLLVAEMVWNEMRAWELKGLLDAPDEQSPEDMDGLRRDYTQRLKEIRGLAHWELGAERGLRELSRELASVLEEHPRLAEDLPELAELVDKPHLESIARAAARELGVDPTLISVGAEA